MYSVAVMSGECCGISFAKGSRSITSGPWISCVRVSLVDFCHVLKSASRTTPGKRLNMATERSVFLTKVLRRMFRAVRKTYSAQATATPEWYLSSTGPLINEMHFKNG